MTEPVLLPTRFPAVLVKDVYKRQLYRSEKFDNIVFLYAEYLFGKAVKGIFVGLLGIELFPAAAEHYA